LISAEIASTLFHAALKFFALFVGKASFLPARAPRTGQTSTFVQQSFPKFWAFWGQCMFCPKLNYGQTATYLWCFLVCLVEGRDWLDILGVDIHAVYLLLELRIDVLLSLLV